MLAPLLVPLCHYLSIISIPMAVVLLRHSRVCLEESKHSGLPSSPAYTGSEAFKNIIPSNVSFPDGFLWYFVCYYIVLCVLCWSVVAGGFWQVSENLYSMNKILKFKNNFQPAAAPKKQSTGMWVVTVLYQSTFFNSAIFKDYPFISNPALFIKHI